MHETEMTKLTFENIRYGLGILLIAFGIALGGLSWGYDMAMTDVPTGIQWMSSSPYVDAARNCAVIVTATMLYLACSVFWRNVWVDVIRVGCLGIVWWQVRSIWLHLGYQWELGVSSGASTFVGVSFPLFWILCAVLIAISLMEIRKLILVWRSNNTSTL